MKALKITLALVVVAVLTVSVVSKESSKQEDTTTYKEYTPKNQIVLEKKKRKISSNA